MMTQERPGSTARGPQHVMIKLQIYNTSPHFGKGIAFEKEAREAVFAAFEKHFKADEAFQK